MRTYEPERSTPPRGESGQVFIMVALLLAVFGGLVAIAVDFGAMAADRRDLQNSADAIALAASQELPNQDAARDVAEDWAERNGIPLAAMELTFVAQDLPTEPNPKVIVELTESHEFVFARLVGITEADVGATAAAVKTSPGGSEGLMPWSVLKAVKDGAVPGESLVLKYDATDVTTGNFGALRLDGNGSNVYRDTIKYGSDTGLCADSVADCPYPSATDTEPGNMRGPTETGTDYRMENTSAACNDWSEVVNVVDGGVMGLKPECNPFGSGGNSESLRVVVVPVISSLCNGECEVTIKEFALFFLEGYGEGGCTGNVCEIKGRFIESNTNYGAWMGVYDEETLSHFVRLVQ